MKGGTFLPKRLIERARANAEKYAWAAEARQRIVEAARPWREVSDDELWDMMFGSTISRSWMVWSNGHCPACRADVPMYSWLPEVFENPWKLRCPHCKELFPKNDFQTFYRSGLDEQGIFDPARADRSLLFNVEHPNPSDSLRTFGVDDGEGYVDGDKRWRFIGAYLIYGQWKRLVLAGIKALADAYVMTGDRVYARKAGVLLDRVADVYPTFDFGEQGVVYERKGDAGCISTWHDACEEVRELAIAYDQVREALHDDKELAAFLSGKAQEHGFDNPKSSFDDVRRNIEDRILRDTLERPDKIRSNFPRQPIALAVIRTVLGWAENRDEIVGAMDEVIEQASAVDGVTGEKGMAGYSASVIQSLARFLERYERMEPGFVGQVLKRHPRLHQTYRFHVDTLCLGRYYPLVGDTGAFARPVDRYVGVPFTLPAGVAPSMFSFLWRLYERTDDAAFVQALYQANEGSVTDLPHDLFAEDPEAFQRGVAGVIAREGGRPGLGSVNKEQWHLAILRSGRAGDERAAWLQYDSGGGHGHGNGMNLGLFAKGLDLMPDFGYPPVHHGGWDCPRADWYRMTASHNTVVVDGQWYGAADGRATLWADGEVFRAIRASGPEIAGTDRFERTVAMVDLSDRDFYLVDLFHVVGGADHAKFMHSHFARLTTSGLSLGPAESYGHGTEMRDFCVDPDPPPAWSVDWEVQDRYGLLPVGSDVHLRYTDLTDGAQAFTCEGWVSVGGYDGTEDSWIPRVMVRRQGAAPLASTFIGIIEPYEGMPNVTAVRRLPLQPDGGAARSDCHVALELRLADGRRDLFVAADLESGPGALIQSAWRVRLDGQMCWVRRNAVGRVERIALCGGRSVRVGDVELVLLCQLVDFGVGD